MNSDKILKQKVFEWKYKIFAWKQMSLKSSEARRQTD